MAGTVAVYLPSALQYIYLQNSALSEIFVPMGKASSWPALVIALFLRVVSEFLTEHL